MTIDSLKDLQKVIQLCRKTGVTLIKIDGIELQLGPKPTTSSKKVDYASDFPEANIPVPQFQGYSQPSDIQQVADKIATSELTEEQLLFYSSTGQAEQ